MPNARRADQIRILTQRRQRQRGFLPRHKAAALRDHTAQILQPNAFHHAPAQYNHLRHKQSDQIRQSEPQIKSLAFDRASRASVSALRQLKNLFRAEVLAAAARASIALVPSRHRRPGCQCLPASAKSASTFRPRRINHVMPHLRMRPVYAAIKLSVQNDPAAYPSAHRNVNQSLLPAARSPSRFTQRRCVAIIFQRRTHSERALQILHWIAAFPRRQEIHVAEFPCEWVHPPRRPNSNPGNFRARLACHVAQHRCDPRQPIGVAALSLRRCLRLGQDYAAIVHDSNRNLRPSDIDSPNQMRSSSNTLTVSPTFFPMACRMSAFTGSLCVPSPRAMNELRNG